MKLDAVAPPHAVRPLDRILRLQASDPTASTTVRSYNEAVARHVADSLSALALAPVRGARRIADLGSGAGWPGLALAAALPSAHVWLVESAIRHCRYLERAVEAGGLENVTVVHARAEEWADGLGAHDLVSARALAALPVILEYAAPLLADGGHVVAWKGAVSPDEAADGAAAAGSLGLVPAGVLATTPFEGARDHTLHTFCKIAATPSRFPRRPGMAVKRPLGRFT
ncbi:MAG TPA: 16S rRNA (guanine(527)-N(7))-methyltransferase RsmG [Solirubrobacter sp.]|nr:16S rRNA (guanine(527)-N(7))-methyltransferase RsmG [Solirubrobacter sp.]